jgi:gliding motility-associated-like protein
VTVEVTPLPLIEIAEQLIDPLCQGDTLSLSSVTVQDDVTYTFSGLDGIVSPDSSATIIVPTMSGTVTLTGDRMGCEVTDMLEVEVVSIAIDLNQPDTSFICQGESIQVQAAVTPGGATVVWNPADVSGSTPTLSPDTYTVYTATVTIFNCVRADTFAIQVDSLPGDMTIMADPMEDSYCQGELVTLSSPIYDPVFYPDITHEWIEIGGETSDTLYNLVLNTQDTFTYQRITVNGGCTQIDTILLNVISNEALQITPANPEVCVGESVQLTVTSTSLGELEWTPAGSLSCDDCPNPIATPTTTTTYTVSSDVEGCVVNQMVTVVVPPDPVLIADDVSICQDESVALNPDGGGGQAGTTYQWTTSTNPNVSTEVNPVVTPATTTTYTGTATNVCGTVTDEVTVTVVEPGALIGIENQGDTIVTCRGFDFDLNAQVQTSNGFNDLEWTYNDESIIGDSVTFTATQTGLATFNYTYGGDEDNICGSATGSVFIIVNDAPQQALVIENMTFCFGLDTLITLFANNGEVEPGVTYEWTSTAGDSFLEADPEVMPTVTTTYYLAATLGECIFIDSVTIEIIETATFDIDDVASTTLISENNPSVDLVSAAVGTDSTNVQWTFNGVVIGEGLQINWEPTQMEQDSLPAYVFATLETGCETLVDSIFIQKLLYETPNIFSPNGDGINDVFKPFFLGEMDVVEVQVYNRWGKVVFESNDPTNPGWDGNKDGDKPAPSDVYLYIVRVGLDGQILEESGEVTLVR